MKLSKRGLLALAVVLSVGGVAGASGAGFKFSAVAVEMGKPDDENAEIPKYKLKVKKGQTVTLVAEGSSCRGAARPRRATSTRGRGCSTTRR